MDVSYTTLLGELDEGDVFLGITASIENKIEDSVGRQHIVSSSFSLLKKQMILKIDNDIEIIVRVTECKHIKTKPLVRMENFEEYEITKEELENVYANDPKLLEVPEPMMYVHECVVEFEMGDCSSKKYEDIAHNLIDLITQNKMIIMLQ